MKNEVIYSENEITNEENDEVNKPFVCTDSDNGKDYFKKGEVVSKDHKPSFDSCRIIKGNFINKPYSSFKADNCSGDKCGIPELYCLGSQNLGFETVLCENGCEDGACHFAGA